MLAVAVMVGVVGFGLLGRTDRPVDYPGPFARSDETASPAPVRSTTPSTPRPAPTPMPGMTTEAREQGLPFDFTRHDLSEWFGSEEITRIVADAYREHGVEVEPRPYSGRPSPLDVSWRSADGGLVRLIRLPGVSVDDLPGRPTDGLARAPISSEVAVERLAAGEAVSVAGMSAYLRVRGHPGVLAFIHVLPEAYAGEPPAFRYDVGLAIAEELLRRMRWIEWSWPTTTTPLPDFYGAVPGDDGGRPLPLGMIDEPPGSVRLDFLFELCTPTCHRDAHWIDPDDPARGSGTWTTGRPFHVREGFPVEGPDPLGEGFGVALYVTRLGDEPDAVTYRYEADYVLRGTSDRCGPTYSTQTGPGTCEWFVHDFPDGLAEGRWAIWAIWEAPCRAWLDYGLANACADPDEVISRFQSGFDAPYGPNEPSYSEVSS